MAATEHLETYLNDHLAGATAGVDLAREIASDVKGTPAGAIMAKLASDIESDRMVLDNLIDDLGLGEHKVKQAAAWMAEKMSRLRLNQVAAGSHEMSLLMSMETLTMGIEGKKELWQALEEIAPSVPEVAALNLPNLIKRAEEQQGVLETYRRAIAPAALIEAEVSAG